nr:hypothetical protein [Cryobacterium algoricola]
MSVPIDVDAASRGMIAPFLQHSTIGHVTLADFKMQYSPQTPEIQLAA